MLTMDEGVMTWNYTNVYADGQLFAMYDAQGLHFDLNDWLGTRRVTTDYAGVVEQTCASLPYGDQRNCTGGWRVAGGPHLAEMWDRKLKFWIRML